MAFYEIPKGWRADVGKDETGKKEWTEFHVQIEYIPNHTLNRGKQYYLRWDEWFPHLKDAQEFLHSFEHGKIRQAWIDTVKTTKTRTKYFAKPYNIEPGKEY